MEPKKDTKLLNQSYRKKRTKLEVSYSNFRLDYKAMIIKTA